MAVWSAVIKIFCQIYWQINCGGITSNFFLLTEIKGWMGSISIANGKKEKSR